MKYFKCIKCNKRHSRCYFKINGNGKGYSLLMDGSFAGMGWYWKDNEKPCGDANPNIHFTYLSEGDIMLKML